MVPRTLSDPGAMLSTTHELGPGLSVRLRLTRPSDEDAVRAFLEALSPETRERRFLVATPAVTPAMVRHFTYYDPRERVMIAATAPIDGREAILGLADMAVLATGLAEIGLIVADDHQSRGIGGLLSEAVAWLALGQRRHPPQGGDAREQCADASPDGADRPHDPHVRGGNVGGLHAPPRAPPEVGRVDCPRGELGAMEAATETQGEAHAKGDARVGELESFNPATGELVGAVPTLTPGDVQAVVDDVAEVQPFWAQLPLSDRARYMRRTAQVVIDDLDSLATLMAREQGKPISECYTMELLPTIDSLHWIADQGPRILGDERIPYPQIFFKQKRSVFAYEPLGVVGVIAPWNYPWSIPFGEVAIALMCGNGVVLKPASLTPLIGQRIQFVFERAGLPEGIVRTIHGGGAVGQALVESSAAKIFFTGSVEVGRGVGVACAERMKGSVLELGGKDPALVLADANMGNTVAGVLWGGFANAGQTCSGIERVYVMSDVAERFTRELAEGAESLTVGDPLDPETEIGPMVSGEQFEVVRELVDDAVASGATLLCGGPREVSGMDGPFFGPTVLTDVTHDMRIMREEIFGPVVPIVVVDSEDEAVQHGQRLRVRAERLGLDPRSLPRATDRPPDRGGERLGQRPLVLARRVPMLLGRSQELRARALALEVRLLRVREHQAPGVGPVAHAPVLVAPLRRVARQGDERLGEAPLRARRRQVVGAPPGRPPAGEGRPQGAARRAEARELGDRLRLVRRVVLVLAEEAHDRPDVVLEPRAAEPVPRQQVRRLAGVEADRVVQVDDRLCAGAPPKSFLHRA